MRVTNKMLSNTFLTDMRNNLENMQTLQQQLSSGKEIRKPSDDPFKVARVMQLNSDINSNKQYNANITDTINWLDTTDTSLGQIGDIAQRVRELMISAGNASYGTQERAAINDEINSKVAELSQVLNTNYDGKYIFGGSRGTAKPTAATTDPVSGNTVIGYIKRDGSSMADSDSEVGMIKSNLKIEISQGVTIDYSVNAGDVLEFKNESGDSCDLRDLLKKVANHLDGKSDDGTTTDPTAASKINTTDLSGITDAINNILNLRAEVGARQNRMDSAKDSNQAENSNMTEILSSTEDIDITQKTMEYSNAQTVYLASLQTSAKIIQPSLLDYL